MKTALVCGAGGFIGGHLVKRLKSEGYWIRAVDLKLHEFSTSPADEFIIGDLRNQAFCNEIYNQNFNRVYQLAADMGGAGYIFTGDNDADVMYNSAMINLNILNLAKVHGADAIFYSSSACIYPEHNQLDSENPNCAEDSAYPANPDSEYGWEKLFSERLYLNFSKNFNLNVKIARFHNIFGPEGVWMGGKEKAPAALCRKVAQAVDGSEIEIWGDGNQTRSFLIVDECIDGIQKLMNSDFPGPVNIGSEEMISINQLAKLIVQISGKNLSIRNINGPVGVRGRNSDNTLIFQKLNWQPKSKLRDGIEQTYRWILRQVEKKEKPSV